MMAQHSISLEFSDQVSLKIISLYTIIMFDIHSPQYSYLVFMKGKAYLFPFEVDVLYSLLIIIILYSLHLFVENIAQLVKIYIFAI
jgi:hypothetical protein